LIDSLNELLLHPAMVRHLHMSLQSGSGKILAAMNRHYTPQQYLDIVAGIRRHDPLYNFTTDVIAVFPVRLRTIISRRWS
jgi:tRNA A37 methylthiotransferase MiaB